METKYPTEHRKSLEFRFQLLAKCEKDLEFRAKVKELFFRDILFAFNIFFYTLDVRRRPEHHRCFCTYEFQDKAIIDIYKAIQGQKDLAIEKSRDMGCSWMVILTYLYCWLDPNGGGDFLLGSRKEEYVDKKGDMRTLFEKARYALYKLPYWIRPKGFKTKKHDYYMRLLNPESGASITGESNNANFSTGGRYTSILFDEFGKWEHTDQSAWTAAGDASPSRIAVSTANGASGQYYKLVTDGKTDKLTLHWSVHPRKAKGLYCLYPKPIDASDIVDFNSWVGLRSPWYDDECVRRTETEIAQELDINYLGAGYPYFVGKAGKRLQELLKHSKKPKIKFELSYGSLELHETNAVDNVVNVFRYPNKDCQYVVSCDVAEGKEDGDFSVIKVLNRMTLCTDASFYTNLDEVQLSKYLVAITKYYTAEEVEEPCWAVEANSLGLAVFDLCTEVYDLPNAFMMPRYDMAKQTVSHRKGWWTSRDSRHALTSGITKWLLDGVGWTDQRCVGEMLTFVKDKNGKPQAQAGNYDDEVMCFGIGLQVHYLLPMDDIEEYNLADIIQKRMDFAGTVVDKKLYPIGEPKLTMEEACLASVLRNKELEHGMMNAEQMNNYFYDY